MKSFKVFTADELADLSDAVATTIQDNRDYCRFDEGVDVQTQRLEALKLKLQIILVSAAHSPTPANPIPKPAVESAQATFNHALAIGFEVPGSKTEDGTDITPEQIAGAISARVHALLADNALLEAVGPPIDTYVE